VGTHTPHDSCKTDLRTLSRTVADRILDLIEPSANLNSVSQVSFGLVHTDYWMGNVLWQGDKITGVIDWEMASYGDPAIDVAYCRMDMRMTGLEEASGHFLDAYQAATDRQVENLEL